MLKRVITTVVCAAACTASAAPPALASAFPGENGRIVFTSTRDSLYYNIYSMRPDGSDVKALTRVKAKDGNPSWSPDGSRIVFASNRTGNSEIFIMNADGSQQRNLSRNYTDCTGLTGMDEVTCNAKAEDGQPSFSADGSQIVFVSFRSGGLGLWIMDSDGSKPRQVSEGGVQPSWSPTGEWIAFSDGVEQGDDIGDDTVLDTDIFVVRPDGTGRRSLTGIRGEKEFYPSWSPDGKQIAFVSDMSGRDQVYVMNVDGTGRRQLTRVGANSEPAWSADGRYVYVQRTTRGRSDIMRVPVTGQGTVNLTKGSPNYDRQPNSRPKP